MVVIKIKFYFRNYYLTYRIFAN